MNVTTLFFPVNNDIVVTATFPEITDGTGMTATFWYKDSKYAADSDPDTTSYQSGVIQGSPGVWLSTFHIPAADSNIPGTYWWRVDVVDAQNKRRTANGGPAIVEAVLWPIARRIQPAM